METATNPHMSGQARMLNEICAVGLLLLCTGLQQNSLAQTAPPDTQQMRPPGVGRVQERIQEIRRTSGEWRRRLADRLSREGRRAAAGRGETSDAGSRALRRSFSLASRPDGISRADLRRVERRLQELIRDILAEEYRGVLPAPPREVAEQFRYVPPDTVWIASPSRAPKPGDSSLAGDGSLAEDSVPVPSAERPTVDAGTLPETAPRGDTVRQVRVERVERELLDTGVFRAFEVNFAFGRSALQPRATRTLDAVGDVLRRYPNLEIEVAGHTDAVGAEEFNQRLSDARADVVRAYLLDRFDLAPGRVVARGYGEARPIASNEERSGRALNRRVEFEVLNPEAVPSVRGR